MKFLNLYAGLGGNRKNLPEEVEVTAVELNPEIAEIYREYFPNDELIIGDAHEYLLKNYKRFDFIHSSISCPTHSRPRYWATKGGRYGPKFPDMKLYEEIIFLKHYADDILWDVENVTPFYEPLIKPTVKLDRHMIWANFEIPKIEFAKENTQVWSVTSSTENYGFSVKDRRIKHRKDQLIRNLVNPQIGRYVFDCAIKSRLPKPKELELFN
jgi:DNA (cytosine-5)-methyltransferase 1